jgi:hypothetical protein
MILRCAAVLTVLTAAGMLAGSASAADRYRTSTGFSIRPAATLSVQAHRYTYLHWLDVTVHWRSNAHTVRTKVRLVRHGKTVWSRSARESRIIGATFPTFFTWHRPVGIRQGTPLKLYVSVAAGGVTKTRVMTVRAP